LFCIYKFYTKQNKDVLAIDNIIMTEKLYIDTKHFPRNRIQEKHIIKATNGTTCNYKILNYDPQFVCFDEGWEVTKYRSVIVDPETHHLLCVAPWGSMNTTEFDDSTLRFEETDTEYVADEMVEGTMINLFYDQRYQKWQIATRRNVGGDYWFYRTEYNFNQDKMEPGEKKQQTFFQMWMDALGHPGKQMDQVPEIQNLPKHYCYSFVMQHKDNHIVYNHTNSSITFVGAFELINHTSEGTMCVHSPETNEWNEMPRVKYINTHSEAAHSIFDTWTQIKFPTIMYGETLEDLKTKFCSSTSPITPMGIMVTHILTGKHKSYDNPRYQYLRELRGNNPNLLYHFLSLWRIGKEDEFVEQFPVYANEFSRFSRLLYSFFVRIHQYYMQYYIAKNKTHIDKFYFVLIAQIHHNLYLDKLKQLNKVVSLDAVKEYFRGMEPSKLFYYWNADNRSANNVV
jgi:hypothetical protein